MGALNIIFVPPSNGWMQVKLTAGEQVMTLDVSHVPCNSLSELVSALLLLQRGSDSEIVRWSLEPAHSEWRFTRIGDELELAIAPFAGSTPELTYRGKSMSVLRAVMKGLCDLAAIEVWGLPKEANSDWSWDFPFEKLTNLKAALKVPK